MLGLANFKPSDIFYDLGCGDASILILAVKEFGVRKAVGFEDNSKRHHIARKRVIEARLESNIVIEKDFYKADLSGANVIFDMLPENKDDYEKLYSNGIKDGTRLIKHELPLLGFLPDKSNYPFYRMTFPLKKAASEDDWASAVLDKKAKIEELWHELYHYDEEKFHSKWDIKRMQGILSRRLSS